MLFAHPLMSSNSEFPIDGITYEKEILDLKDELVQLELEINFSYGILTTENLKDTLLKNPTILHLICHGGFDPKGKFYLGFENS